jgi:hypothetical protein
MQSCLWRVGVGPQKEAWSAKWDLRRNRWGGEEAPQSALPGELHIAETSLRNKWSKFLTDMTELLMLSRSEK